MKGRAKKRVFSLLLSVTLVTGLLPGSALATEIGESQESQESETDVTTQETSADETEVESSGLTDDETILEERESTEETKESAESETETESDSTQPEEIKKAALNANTSTTHTVFSSTTSNIAPGVTQSTNYAYMTADNQQVVYYVATADISRDDVKVQTSYKDAQCSSFGMAKLTDQISAANAKYSDSNNKDFIGSSGIGVEA